MRSLRSLLPGLWDWPTGSKDIWSLYQAVGIGPANVAATNNLKVSATQTNKSFFLVPSTCQWALSELFLHCALSSALSVVTGQPGCREGKVRTGECRLGSCHLLRTSYGSLLTARQRHRQLMQVPGRKEVIGEMKSFPQEGKGTGIHTQDLLFDYSDC